MSNKFTGITSGGQEIPVYDKAALHDAYSAGNNIRINDNVISVTGRKSLAVQSPLSAEVSGNSIIISLDESALDVSSKLDTSAFAEVSGSFLTSGDLDGYATEGFVESAVSGKADTSAIPSLDGYATEQWVGEQGYLTEVPEGYATTEDVISATSGLQPSGDYASATDLANYQPVSAMTGYQAAGDYLSGNALDSLSGTWETVTAKADTTALEAYQTIEGMSAYQPSGDYQPAGSYLSANALDSVSGYWNEVSAKLDTTAFSDVSGSFLTSVPDTYLQNTDLTIVDNKITEISGVPLSAGDELPASVSAATDYVTATSGNINDTISNVSANSGTWGGDALPISARDGLDLELSGDMLWIGASALNETLSGKQDTLTFEYNESSAISAINGSALAGGGGGGDVPEGVMVESAVGYNAVNEISGYNGSAIAQYGAEKQWLVHDDTLVHAANSAQYALGVNLSAVAQLLGVDETVLFSSNSVLTTGFQINLSEPLANFDRINVYWKTFGRQYVTTIQGNSDFQIGAVYTDSNAPQISTMQFNKNSDTQYTLNKIFHQNVKATADTQVPTADYQSFNVSRVVGVHRING